MQYTYIFIEYDRPVKKMECRFTHNQMRESTSMLERKSWRCIFFLRQLDPPRADKEMRKQLPTS